jgi:hypothetical protein
MADLFISYARSDRPRAEQLAHALERAGWSVWWDREIPPGRSFDEVIEEALSLARCVIVLWSEASVRSEWVKTEAAEAAQRRILVPILADGARIPLEFRRIQAAMIDNWRHLEAAEGWGQLCDAVAALVDSPRRALPAPVAVPAGRVRTLWIAAAILTLGVVAASSVLAMRWRSAGGDAPSAPAAATTPAAAVVTPAPAPAAAPAAASSPVVAERRSPPPPVVAARPVRPAARVAPEPAVADAPSVAPLPIDVPPPAKEIVAKENPRKLDHEPRLETAAAFDVTLLYGVFRDQAGRLSVSAGSVRFQETGGSRSFDLPCGAIKRLGTATMIADRDQRLLELSADGQAYRVRAADTGARDTIRATIARTCGH